MIAVLGGLFVTAFLSATLLPGTSEIALAGIVSAASVPAATAVLVATVGNTAGSVVNWGLGRFFIQFRGRRWFPVAPAQLERYGQWYRRWGLWSLLLSWVPVIGDPLTVAAGIARTPWPLFAIIVFVAKGARYLVVAGAVDWLM